MYMHRYAYGEILMLVSLTLIVLVLFAWWRDITREATYQGLHTLVVQKGLRLGVILFIVSEVAFFFSFFWAFFHSAPSSNSWIRINMTTSWDYTIKCILKVPLSLNTAILLSSGANNSTDLKPSRISKW